MGLRKSYHSGNSEIVVFESISLYVPRHERLAIIGESGAGKSTLLHLLGGLDRPTAGAVVCDGHDLGRIGSGALADLRNRQIGFVWQNPSLLPEFTALENVMMPLLIRGTARVAAAQRARQMLGEVGLSEREQHQAGELSGGEQQRVAIARAIVGEPSVLMADEPTGSLDFRTGNGIALLLKRLHDQHGLTSIYVTHNLSFAQNCDRVLELRKGALHPVEFTGREFSGKNEEIEVPRDGSGSQSVPLRRDATRLDGGQYV